MGAQTEPQRTVASVLVIAADRSIESLVGELVAFAGYRPIYDPTAGAAGESVRRIRPDVTLLDTSLALPVVRACLAAADEVGSSPVLMSSTASPSELIEEARSTGRLYFPLPGGPRPLARIIESAISDRQSRSVTALPERRQSGRAPGSVHPALCAALASVARARALALHAEAARNENRLLRDEMRTTLAESERSRAALRAAVTDYAKQLKAADITMDAVVIIVHDAICDCAAVVGAEDAMSTLLQESEEWTRQAYHVA